MEDRVQQVLERLKANSNPQALAGMARYGIRTERAYGGTSVPALRKMARELGQDHALAQALWDTGVREARLLATMVDDPSQVTEEQMERWAGEFDSWDVCDGTCSGLFRQTPFAYKKAVEWSTRREEYVKRAGFVLIAALAVHDKKAPDEAFERFFPIIEAGALDDRNFVKKAVNWALRQTGKRNRRLNQRAAETARHIQALESPSARWVASDALRELTSEAVQRKLRAKEARHG